MLDVLPSGADCIFEKNKNGLFQSFRGAIEGLLAREEIVKTNRVTDWFEIIREALFYETASADANV